MGETFIVEAERGWKLVLSIRWPSEVAPWEWGDWLARGTSLSCWHHLPHLWSGNANIHHIELGGFSKICVQLPSHAWNTGGTQEVVVSVFCSVTWEGEAEPVESLGMVPACLLEAVECQESWVPEPQSQDPYSDSVAYKVCDPGKLLNFCVCQFPHL